MNKRVRLERGHRKRAAKGDTVLPPISWPNIFNQLSDLATPLNKSAPEAEDQSFPLPITPADSNVSLLGANVKKSDVKTADTDVKKAETDVKSLKSDVTEEQPAQASSLHANTLPNSEKVHVQPE